MIVLIVWTVFSIIFIGVNQWNQFKANQLSMALRQGYQQAVIDVAAAANKCDNSGVPLNVVDKDNKPTTVTIVGVTCLQQAQAAQQKAGNPGTPATPAAPAK